MSSGRPGTSSSSGLGMSSSFQPPSVLYCKSCNVSVTCNAEWLAHLVGENHQLPKRTDGKGQTFGMIEWDKNRTIRILGINGIPALKVANAINAWGPIEDISYLAKKDGGTHTCHILMRTMESAQSIVRNSRPIKIGNRNIGVKRWFPSPHFVRAKTLSVDTVKNWESNARIPGGIQANGKFFCKSCSETIFPMAGWITHLTGEAHQLRHKECRFVRKIFWDPERTVRVGEMVNVPAEFVLNYLLEYGPIEDFSYLATKKQKTAPLCYCLFSCLSSVQKITANPKHAAYTKQGNHLSLMITPIHPDLKARYKKMAESYQTKKRNKSKSEESLVIDLNEEADAAEDLEEAIYIPGRSMNTEMVGSGDIPLGKLVTEPNSRQRKHRFDCVKCDEEFHNTEEWWEHLASLAHRRETTSIAGGGLKYCNHTETVLLRGLQGISRMDILRFAGSWGPVQDLLYFSEKDGTADTCYVRFESSETAEKILSCSSFLVIGSSQIIATAVQEYAGWSKAQRKALQAEKHALQIAADVKAKLNSKSAHEEGVHEVISLLQGKELLQQLDDLVNHVSWEKDFLEKCKEIVEEDIPFVLRKASFPISQKLKNPSSLLPFGQYVTGITSKQNLTVQLLLNTKVENVQEIVSILHDLRKVLEKCTPSANLCPARPTVNSIQNPDEASVDFGSELRFTNLALKNEFVIRLGNRLPLQESNLIQFYTKLDPRIKPAITVISCWIEMFKLMKFPHEEDAFPQQTVSFLVLFFLIHQKIVPTVHHLTQKLNASSINVPEQDRDLIPVEGYSVSFCNDLNVVKPNKEVLDMLSDPGINAHSCLGLVKDILEFYGSVDLEKYVLCLRFGTLVPKVDFLPENVGQLPGELGRLYRFSSNGVHRSKFLNICSLLVLQDPFVLHLNLTLKKGAKRIKRFQTLSKHAAIRLENQMISEQPNLCFLFKWKNETNQNNNDKVAESLDDSKNPDNDNDNDDKSRSSPSAKRIKLDPETIQDNDPCSGSDEVVTRPESTTSSHSETKTNNKDEINEITVKQENKQEQDVIDISDHEDDGWDKPESPSIFDLQGEYEDVDDYEDNDNIRMRVDLTKPLEDLEGVEDFDDNISVISAEEEEDGEASANKIVSNAGSSVPVNDQFAEITLNRSLQVYFSRNFNGPNPAKINKLQVLLLQYIIEFNSIFWTRCFNLSVQMTGSYDKWTMPSFAVVDGVEGRYTLEERLSMIDLSSNKIDLQFVVQSSLPKVHPFIEKNTDSIRWKVINAGGAKDPTLGEITKLLIADHDDSVAKLKESLFVPLTSKNYLQMDGHLKAAIVTNANFNISLGRCKMTTTHPQMETRKVALLLKMWKKLQGKYCDRMVKRWLSSCKDFDRSKADNFQVSVEQERQRKANKNTRKHEKYINKKLQSINNNPGVSLQSNNPNLVPIGPKKGILKKPAQSFSVHSVATFNSRSPAPRQVRPSYYRNPGPPMPMSHTWRPQNLMDMSVYGSSPQHSGPSPSYALNSLQTPETYHDAHYSTGLRSPCRPRATATMRHTMQYSNMHWGPNNTQHQFNSDRFPQPQRFPSPTRYSTPDSDKVPIYRRM